MKKHLLSFLILAVFFSCKTKQAQTDFSDYATGIDQPIDQNELKKVSLYVPSESRRGESLASSASMDVPPIGNQAPEGSCSAWAIGYNQFSTAWNYKGVKQSYDPSVNTFSPEYLFNINKSGSYCDGASLLTCLNTLVNKGICTLAAMPQAAGCDVLPNASQYANAANYKITSYSKILVSDVATIKSLLAANRPVISQVTIDDNFRNQKPGEIWNSFSTNPGFHALCLIGYDDAKQAYKGVNQWGVNYGDSGFFWVDYNFWATVSSDMFVLNFDVPTCPASGTFLRTGCIGFDKYNYYTNGSCGEYATLVEANSTSCGYVPPVTDTEKPIITASANTLQITKFTKSIKISATATDNSGVVTSMSITVNGITTNFTGGSCSYIWAINKWLPAGSYNVVVKAKDRAGNEGVNNSITIKK